MADLEQFPPPSFEEQYEQMLRDPVLLLVFLHRLLREKPEICLRWTKYELLCERSAS